MKVLCTHWSSGKCRLGDASAAQECALHILCPIFAKNIQVWEYYIKEKIKKFLAGLNTVIGTVNYRKRSS